METLAIQDRRAYSIWRLRDLKLSVKNITPPIMAQWLTQRRLKKVFLRQQGFIINKFQRQREEERN